MRRNSIPTNELIPLEELVNLLTHLTATFSRHQTHGLENGKRGTSRLPRYTFICKAAIKKAVYIWRNLVDD